ncbi:MAG: IPTL-CTERM sorting domain-containing protein, partial [Dehalococcoidia bacterium]|nr:IPTL-CTERM sorting domain-containing protein [Dehalococcoidia bacterium]
MHGKKVMVVTLCALLLFGALAFASVSLGQQKALADEATFYSTSSDGFLEIANSSYTAAHDAANADVIWSALTWSAIGQAFISGNYQIYRNALFFDTSSLPDSAVVTAATLSLYGSVDYSTTDFDITVVDGSLLNDPLVLGDYGDLLTQTISGGAFNTSGFSVSGYNDIPLNPTGMGWISKTGMTKFGLRSSREIASIVPRGYEAININQYEEGVGYQPRLVVSYDTAAPTPTIPPPPSPVPTLSQWGMIGMAIVLSVALVWSIRRRLVVRT